MNRFLILLTMLLTPLLALGQSTAVLDGIGLANGKSYTNYIKNPNAQKNTANVTASNLTVARSTTTPLYSAAEFNLTSTSTPWSATWSALAFDAGMKNRLCEVQIMLRGTAAGTTTLEVLQNSVAVFTQTVTLDATNPKKYGGTFPCGDLTYASTVKLGGTGATTGAIEAGAVYLGEPVSVSSGGITTQETTYTAVSFGGQGTLSVTQNELKWWRVGQHIYVRGRVTIGAGTGAASPFSVPFPTGVALASGGVARQVAQATFYDASGGTQTINIPSANPGDTSFIFVKTGGGAILGSDLGASDELTFTAGPFAVAGWSATDIVTPEASIRSEISANAASVTATYPNTATIASITLTPGSWLVHGEDVVYSSVAPAAGSTAASGSDLYDGSSVILDSKYSAQVSNAVVGGDTNLFKVQSTTYVTVAAGTTKTISFRLRSDALSGVPTGAAFTSRGYGKLFAIPYNTAGSQSFYISSPLVAPPDGTGIKLKSSTNVDLMTINDTTGAAIIGASSGATGGHSVRANTTIPFSVKNNNTADNSFVQFANGTGTLGYIGFNPSTGFRAIASNGSTDWGGSDTNGKWDFGPSTAGNIKHKANGSLHAQFSTGVYNIGGYTTNDSVTLAATGGTDSLTITTDTGNSGYLLSVNGVSAGSGALLYITYASATITKLADPNSIIAAGSLAVTKSASSYDVKIENLSGGAFALGVQAIGAKITAATPGT